MAKILIPITRERFEAARAKLIKQGVNIPPKGDVGSCGANGVVVNYDYDGDELRIDVLTKPRWISARMVEARIRGWFAV